MSSFTYIVLLLYIEVISDKLVAEKSYQTLSDVCYFFSLYMSMICSFVSRLIAVDVLGSHAD